MWVPLPQPPRGWILYDSACGFCSRWVPSWASTLTRAGFGIAPLQSPWLSGLVDLDAPDSWDLMLLRPGGSTVVGADAYREVMRRIWWAYPLYMLTTVPGLYGLFQWAYRAFARNRYGISRACGLESAGRLRSGPTGGE